MPEPRRWSSAQLETLAIEAVKLFRTERVGEPRIYSAFFEAFAPVFRDMIENALPALLKKDVDRELLAKIVSSDEARTAFRYLAAPPISDDDLKTLASTSLSAAALRTDAAQAERVRDAVLNVIDPHRFPWIGDNRNPRDGEKNTAIIASAVLVATQKVSTSRRSSAKRQQEEAVKTTLKKMHFREVPPRNIPLLEDGPRPGEFCGESKLGDTRADLVVRLADRRYLAIECKVSNSAVNSFKRLNHEALGKARRWLEQFGRRAVVPAAVLSGVFNKNNLEAVQDGGLALFWGHRLGDLETFIATCRPKTPQGQSGR